MRFLRRAFAGLFLVALTVGLLAYAAGSVRDALQARADREPGQSTARERVFAARVATYDLQTVTPILTSFGEIRSRRTLELRAPARGRIVEIGPDVEEGGRVAEGQLVARIDPTEAERTLRVAETDLRDAEGELTDASRGREIAADDLESARAQAELRSRALSRQQDLAARGVGTAAIVEEAELAAAAADQQVLSRRRALAEAEARVSQAETALARRQIALDEAQRTLDDTDVTAAFSGILSDLALTEGGLVSQTERLADLVDPDALEVAFRVSTAEYGRLAGPDGRVAGRAVQVRLDVGGTTIDTRAKVTREAAAVGDGETGRRLFAQIESPGGFRPGDFVRVLVTEPVLRDVAVLPAAAIDASGTLLAVSDDERLERVGAELLRRQGDQVIVRADGIDGREVVAERSPLLGPGIRIRPVRPDGDANEDDSAAPDMVELSADRRAALIAQVEEDREMAAEAKERVLAQLREERVPAGMVARLEAGDTP